MSFVSLADLLPGEQARICGFGASTPDYRQKLLAMGLTPNTPFTVVRRAPLGDPVQIQVRNFFLSLRQTEARTLLIEKI